MALVLIARDPDGSVRLLSKEPFTASRYALVRLETLAGEAESNLRGAEVYLLDIETAQPVLIVWPPVAPVGVPSAQTPEIAVPAVPSVRAESAVETLPTKDAELVLEPQTAVLSADSDLFVIDPHGDSFQVAAASLRTLIASVVEDICATPPSLDEPATVADEGVSGAPDPQNAEAQPIDSDSCETCVFPETCPDAGLKSPDECGTFQRR
ncbi:MAG: hypothetical protein HGA39_00990 [Coriobacteriia bacterium]|nr:hypothetical protein [Coriobacteriia bacterium]